jgi:hypothetical protein
MSPQGLLELTRARPFRPFRIVLTDGATYDIQHPELLMVGVRDIVIGIAAAPAPTLFVRPVIADLLHVVRAEPLPDAPPQGNGASA